MRLIIAYFNHIYIWIESVFIMEMVMGNQSYMISQQYTLYFVFNDG